MPTGRLDLSDNPLITHLTHKPSENLEKQPAVHSYCGLSLRNLAWNPLLFPVIEAQSRAYLNCTNELEIEYLIEK